MANYRKSETNEGKRKRVPFGGFRSRLQVSDSFPGYVLRWFNDVDGRIQRAQDAGYVFVKAEEVSSLGEHQIHQDNSDLNGNVSKVVSRGEPVIRAYLMKIKEEWYQEDQREKEKVNKRTDDALRQGRPGGEAGVNRYIPREGITIPD